MISFREPVYQGVAESPTSDYVMERPVARRPPLGRSLKDRLTNIVSMHVPSNQPFLSPSRNLKVKEELVEEGGMDGTNDRFGLLTLHNNENNENHEGLCEITAQLDKNTLFKAVEEALHSENVDLPQQKCVVASMTFDQNFLYICVEDVPYVFKIPTTSLPRSKLGLSLDKVYLKLPDSLELLPSALCLKQTQNETRELFIIGQTRSATSNVSFNMLVCFSPEGRLIAQTRKYPYRRFVAIDIDCDGNPLLSCAAGPEGTPAAQICKLTPHFERRIFSITMRRDQTIYQPQWITKTSTGGQCWASVSRVELDTSALGEDEKRRIFSFPGCQPVDSSDLPRSPKEWLRVISWNFDEFAAGAIAALDAEHLLAVDTERRSLALITWRTDEPSPNLQRIIKPSDRTIDFVCTSASLPEVASGSVAFFVSQGDIYKFSLPENRIVNAHY
ncbi:unnamed protein product [Schistocephalus solidus]|uniref:DUF5736 domain-containing protein n=1 Tax=Schistocephalus solidus TaxID=70667 RepID=A0A0V0JBH3_SCHSO|nr:unnamed protein product [Schistocephalus solidus]